MSNFFTNLEKLISIYKTMNKENASVNNLPFKLYWSNKIVEMNEGVIYRADTPSETLKRILIQKLFKLKDLDIFAEETIIKELSCDFVTVTSQEKLIICDESEVETQIEKTFEEDRQLKIQELFNKYSISWYQKDNSGIDKNGKIKIFDYTANLALSYDKDNNPILVDTNGEALISEKGII